MSFNPVMTAIYAAFKLEIANQFVFSHNALIVTLPNKSQLAIKTNRVQSNKNCQGTNNSTTTHSSHTFHYLHQHDFTADNRPLEKIWLHNLAECHAYLDDVCTTFLNAHIYDGEIKIFNNTTYLVTIEPI